MSGKAGHSPAKSRRRQRQRQQSAARMRAALDSMSTMAQDLTKRVEPLAQMAKEKMGERVEGDVPAEEGAEGEGG